MAVRTIDLGKMLRPNTALGAVLALSVVMVLAVVIATAAVLLDLRRRELAHAQGEIVSLSRVLSDQTTRAFDGVVLAMRGAREHLSDDIGRRLELDSLPIHFLLQARIAGLPQVRSMFVVDPRGYYANSSHPDFSRRLSVADRAFFRYFADGGRDEIFISQSVKARVDNQWTYYVSMPVLDASGRLRCVLAASISIDYFESLYDSIGLDSVSRILLLDREGILMAGMPRDEALFGKLAGNPASLAALSGKLDGGELVASEEASAGRRFVAYRKVAKYPLVIGAAVDEYEALAPWRHVVWPIVGGMILLVLFVLATTYLLVRNLRRKDALESTLKERDEQLRHMVQSVRDAIVTVNCAREVVLFNAAAEKMFGVRAEAAIGREIGTVLSGCLRQPQLLTVLRYLDEGWRSPAGLVLFGIIELLRDEKEFLVEMSLSTTTFRDEILLTAIFRDLSERQRAERELLETNRQLQDLSASLQNVREEERARIARELHDELGQLLTGIRMEVSWLGGRLQPGQQALTDKIGSVKGQIDQTIASVRRISSELRPLVLDDLGFAAAAGWYVDQFSARTGLPVALILPADAPEQGDVVATALFRVLQESLTNVARHARATHVDVRLSFLNEIWTLSIRDDGIGFVQESVRRGGLGLIGMRERVQILGGQFSVTTAPGEGTAVEVILPAHNNTSEQ